MFRFVRELLMILILPAGIVLGIVWIIDNVSSSTEEDIVINIVMKCEVQYGSRAKVSYEGDDCARYKTYVDVGIENWTGKFWQEIKVRTPEGEKYTVDIPCPLSSDGTSSLCTFEDELPKFGDKWPRDSRP